MNLEGCSRVSRVFEDRMIDYSAVEIETEALGNEYAAFGLHALGVGRPGLIIDRFARRIRGRDKGVLEVAVVKCAVEREAIELED